MDGFTGFSIATTLWPRAFGVIVATSFIAFPHAASALLMHISLAQAHHLSVEIEQVLHSVLPRLPR